MKKQEARAAAAKIPGASYEIDKGDSWKVVKPKAEKVPETGPAKKGKKRR